MKDEEPPEVSEETVASGQKLVSVRLRFGVEIQGFGPNRAKALERASALRDLAQRIFFEITQEGYKN